MRFTIYSCRLCRSRIEEIHYRCDDGAKGGLDHDIRVPRLARSVQSAASLAKNSCRRISTDSTVQCLGTCPKSSCAMMRQTAAAQVCARDGQCIFSFRRSDRGGGVVRQGRRDPRAFPLLSPYTPGLEPQRRILRRVESLHPKGTGHLEMIPHRGFRAQQFDGSKGYMGTAFRDPNNLISTSCGQATARPRIFPADPIAKHTARSRRTPDTRSLARSCLQARQCRQLRAPISLRKVISVFCRIQAWGVD